MYQSISQSESVIVHSRFSDNEYRRIVFQSLAIVAVLLSIITLIGG